MEEMPAMPQVEPQVEPVVETIDIFEENQEGMVVDPLKVEYEKNIPEKIIPEEPFEGFAGNVEVAPPKVVESFEGFVEETVSEKK